MLFTNWLGTFLNILVNVSITMFSSKWHCVNKLHPQGIMINSTFCDL